MVVAHNPTRLSIWTRDLVRISYALHGESFAIYFAISVFYLLQFLGAQIWYSLLCTVLYFFTAIAIAILSILNSRHELYGTWVRGSTLPQVIPNSWLILLDCPCYHNNGIIKNICLEVGSWLLANAQQHSHGIQYKHQHWTTLARIHDNPGIYSMICWDPSMPPASWSVVELLVDGARDAYYSSSN